MCVCGGGGGGDGSESGKDGHMIRKRVREEKAVWVGDGSEGVLEGRVVGEGSVAGKDVHAIESERGKGSTGGTEEGDLKGWGYKVPLSQIPPLGKVIFPRPTAGKVWIVVVILN